MQFICWEKLYGTEQKDLKVNKQTLGQDKDT